MACDFTSFLTIFQLYKDDGWMIIEGFVPSNLVNVCKDFCGLHQVSNPRPLEQHAIEACLTQPSGHMT